jgi:predicted MPP superfamily phosphohydrolase
MCLIIVIIYFYIQNNWIEVENIKVEIDNLPEELNGIKIAQISDLHLPNNASTIDNIINEVKKQKPDIVILTGDVIDDDADLSTCGLNRLCEGLSQIKTYAVSGNHEHRNKSFIQWFKMLERNNIKVIDNKIEILNIREKDIAILGVEDGLKYSNELYNNINDIKEIPAILLTHRPGSFDHIGLKEDAFIPDIVFCGHIHGGQFRIPFINRGILSPEVSFFPPYTSGVYFLDSNSVIIISRGLGNSVIPVRINNRPHLPIVKLVKK